MLATPLSFSGELMISFEISLIDIVLAMAIIILLLVHMGGARTEHTTGPELSQKNWKEDIISLVRKGKEESLRRIKKRKEFSFAPSPEGFVKCPNHFGYLKTLSLGNSAPEECYSCSRMMQCLLSNEDRGEPKNNMISYRR